MSINRPIMCYHGGKYRLAPWIVQHFPAHRIYVEPFGGAASVLMRKPRSPGEVYNDLDGEIVNVMRVFQDRAQREKLAEFELAQAPCDAPVERARRTLIRAEMGFGSAGATKRTTGFRIDTKRPSNAMRVWARIPENLAALGQRLQGVLIENREALQVLRDHDTPNTLFYVDPPYVHGTRKMSSACYRYEMDNAAHRELLAALLELKGMVLLSGYAHPLYDALLAQWKRVETATKISAQRGVGIRTEILWISPRIEAATVAWQTLGWRAAWFSEIEPFPCAVLAHHYPDVPNFGDMTRFQEWPDATLDLLVGGTPCQSFSVAGLRKGLADPRGNLRLTYLAMARRYAPRWLVWENVPGVLYSNGGRDFGTFLGGLEKLGYGFAYRVLDAQYIRVQSHPRAVPQRRRRVFVVGYLGDWRCAAAVLFERESLLGHPAPRRSTGQSTAPTLSARARGGGGLGTDFDCDGGLISHTLRGDGFDAGEDGTGRGIPLTVIPFDTTQITSAGNHSVPRTDDPCHPLMANAHPPAIAFDCKASGQNGFGAGEIAPTMRSMGHANSHQNGGGHQAVAYEGGVRRLTPRECERLQGFPDDFTRIPVRTLKQRPGTAHFAKYPDLYDAQTNGTWTRFSADGPRYKALGNSMAIAPMRWIGERISLLQRQQQLSESTTSAWPRSTN
ncbi:hypothetical protein DFQ30_007469 [Apophysomyces sp. BC1015]|nr:hypothetical protein DFQ30_007469 [Apophysomyces sp. BC1015]